MCSFAGKTRSKLGGGTSKASLLGSHGTRSLGSQEPRTKFPQSVGFCFKQLLHTAMAHARTTLSQASCSTPPVSEISFKPNFQSHRLLMTSLLLSMLYHYSFTRHWGPKDQTSSSNFLAGMHSVDIAKCPLAKRYVSNCIYWGRWKVALIKMRWGV